MPDNRSQQVAKEIEPILFIGLGGAGGEVVARLKRKFDLYFATASPQERARAGLLQYLVADTANYELLSQTARSVIEKDKDFVYLGGFNGNEYITQQIKVNKDLQDWWDQRYFVPNKLIDNGASAVRMLGRICLFRSSSEAQGIRNRLNQKLDAAYQIEKSRSAGTRSCRVFIITGSGGGTGSGTYIDTAFLTWQEAIQVFTQPPQINTFIFLPFLHAEVQRDQNPSMARRVKANAHALFEELEYFLDRPGEINRLNMNAVSRRESGFEPISGWRPFDKGYLVDYRVEGIGNFQRLDDQYSYIAKAIFHLYLTPDAAFIGNVTANIDQIIYIGRDSIRGKRTAYSSIGLSSIEYPQELILSYLYARYSRDIIKYGFLNSETKMADIARKQAEGDVTKGEQGWADRLGRLQLQQLSQQLEAEVGLRLDDKPNELLYCENDSQGKPRQGKLSYDRIAQVGNDVQMAKTRIETTKPRLKEIYDRFASDTYPNVHKQIQNLIDNCEQGLHFARELIVQTDNLLTEELKRTRVRIRDLDRAMVQAQQILNTDEKQIGSRRNIEDTNIRKNRKNLSGNLKSFLDALTSYLENGIRIEAEKLKEKFLIEVTGEPEAGIVTEQVMQEVTTGFTIKISILDKWRQDLDSFIHKLEGLLAHADDEMRLEKFFAIAGRELTTRYIPEAPNAEALAKSQEVRSIYQQKVPIHLRDGEETPTQEAISQEMQEILQQWRIDETLVPKLCDVEKSDDLVGTINRILQNRAREHFDTSARQSVWGLFKDDKNEQQIRSELTILAGQSQPSCPIDRFRLAPIDNEKVTTLWSAGGEQPDEIVRFLPEEAQNIATAYTGSGQLSILKTVHGFPLYTTRFFNDMRIEYNILSKDEGGCLHIRHQWNPASLAKVEDIERFIVLVSDNALLYFGLGVFFKH
jgi:hypothetical protein